MDASKILELRTLRQTAPLVLICVLLSSCGNTTKTTESTTTTDGYGQTRTVEVQQNGNSRVTTETIRTVEPNSPEYDEESGATITIDDQGIDNTAPSRTRVRAPGVKIDTDEASGEVHVDVPFVKINKEAGSNKVNVKVPFVNINADAND